MNYSETERVPELNIDTSASCMDRMKAYCSGIYDLSGQKAEKDSGRK